MVTMSENSSEHATGAQPVTATEHRIVVPAGVSMVGLLGTADEFLRAIEAAFAGTQIHARGNEITVAGASGEVALVERLVDELVVVLRTGQVLTTEAIERSVAMLRSTGWSAAPADVLTFNILSNRGRTIRPKTLNQKRYVDAIDQHTVIFGIGPAGTGKTYLAVAKAIQALQTKKVTRIILTRPAVEAGERLGFLPGTLYDKIDPYLRPLYDALHDMVDPETIPRLMAAGTIEVAPLAYMRGRAQPVGTDVLTPQGFRSIGSLRVGDLVIGSDGRPTPVLGSYPQGRKEVFRVATQDGASTLACGEHLWFVTTRDDRSRGKPGRVVQTRDMIGDLQRAHNRRFELPLVRPVEIEPREVPIDAYALGLRLGDGCLTLSTAPSVATTDPELAVALDRALPNITLRRRSSVDYAAQHQRGGRGIAVADPDSADRRHLGLGGTRSTTTLVPMDYLVNSVEVRLAVLQGLLDSDGGAVRHRGRTCRIQYTTCSDRLRDDVLHLVRSLGGVASARTGRAAGRLRRGTVAHPSWHRSDAHVLDIWLPEGIAPFRLARKREIYEASGGARPMRIIESIEPAGEDECVCISVAAQDSLYVTDDFLVTHNTLNDAFIILDEAQNTTAEQMKMFLTRLGFNSKMVVTGDVTQTDLPGGTRSGLIQVQGILDDIEDVAFLRLTSSDVIRHRLVSEIVDAYHRHDTAQEAAAVPPRQGGGGRQSGRR